MASESPFDHVILTRFSVQMGFEHVFDDEWLLFRWGFFQEALASSLRSQTVRDFKWLVFFDAKSPEWLRENVAECSPDLFTPVYDGRWNHRRLRDAVEAVTTKPYLITTRIDSDDAVSHSFVEDVQARFDEQESMYVNLMRGVQVDRSLQLFHANFVENGFISYIERRIPGTEPRTVFQCFAHEESSSFAPVLNVVGPVRWMQVIHGTNLANSVRGLRAYPDRAAREFSIDLEFIEHVNPGRFLIEWVVSLGHLIRLWARHPTFAVVYWRALRLQLRGTTTVPQHVHRESRIVVSLRKTWRRLQRRRTAGGRG